MAKEKKFGSYAATLALAMVEICVLCDVMGALLADDSLSCCKCNLGVLLGRHSAFYHGGSASPTMTCSPVIARATAEVLGFHEGS
eukprot:scaffold15301_cov142-Cylindrotheca_fusiformis.AAC.3